MQHSISGSESSPRLDELSSHSNDGRILALQQGQAQLEERMSVQFQQIQTMLRNLTSPPTPAVSSHPNMDTAETPARFNRRSSTDTRASLNDARNFHKSATKLPQTASGSEVNQSSHVRTQIGRDDFYSNMTIQHPEQFKLQAPISKITLQQIRNLENEILVYLQKPQNTNQQIYLFNDQFLTPAARNYLVNQIHERNTNLKVPATHE